MGEVTFPNEIWLEIFKYINIRKLMELRLVCRSFHDMIEECLDKHTGWEQMVYDESTVGFEDFPGNTISVYSEDFIPYTMQRANPYHLLDNEDDDGIKFPALWRNTYWSHKKWQKVLVNSKTKHTIVSGSAPGDTYISYVRTFDKYIAIAFENSTIANYTTDDLCQPFYTAHQGNGEVLVVTVGEDSVLRFWDLQDKVEISTKGFFANTISCGECRHFCVGEMNGIVTSYERVGDRITAGLTKDLQLRADEVVVVQGLEGKYMMGLANDLHRNCSRMFTYQGTIEDGRLTEFNQNINKGAHRIPENLTKSLKRIVMPICTYFFGIGGTSIGFINCNYSPENWREYDLVHHFGSNVTSLALHAHILMFGLEDGSVHLIHIYSFRSMAYIEEAIKEARKIEVDNVPIIDLTVLEVDKKPCIVAVTQQKVHLLDFF